MKARIDGAVVAAWTSALDAYSAVLDEHRTMLVAAEIDVDADLEVSTPPAFVPPTDLAPLPESLLSWAKQLLEQTDGLAKLAGELVDRSERSLAARAAANRTRPVVAPATASTWDTLL